MEAVTDLAALNSSEKTLVSAAQQDTVADLRAQEDGDRPVIRAELLRELCTGGRQWNVKDRIRMIGGRVEGRLDLSGAHLAHPLEFTDCAFGDIDLRKARAEKSLAWVGERGARIGALLADEFDSDAGLTVAGVTVAGVISLHWANVRGDLRLTNSHLVPPADQAVAGRDVRVGGTLFMDGPDFRAEGEVCLRSAHVQGDVNCRHARFDNPSGRSIDGDHLVVDGEILLQGYHDDTPVPAHYGRKEDFHSNGEVSLESAQVHRLRATGGKFANPSGFALHADAMHAEDGIYLDRGFEATAEVRLVGARITGELCCTKGTFSNPSGIALNAEGIEADDVYLDRGFTAKGQVRFTDARVRRRLNATGGDLHNEHAGMGELALAADGLACGEVFLNEGFHAIGAVSLTGAKIKGQLNCTAGSFDNPDGYALFADWLTTPGMVYLDKSFRAIGEVRFARAAVGRQLVCTDGTFDNQHGIALNLTGVRCRGDVLLNSTGSGGRYFRATGQVRIKDAQITRDLDFTNARLHGDEGVNARGLTVGGHLTWKLDPPPEGPTDLSHAQIGRLDDTPESWPEGRYSLTGISYQTVSDFLTREQRNIDFRSPDAYQQFAQADQQEFERRKFWLRHTDVYSPDAYQQLANIYRQAGRYTDAQEILIASQRDLRNPYRGRLPWYSRVWSWFIDISVGYGYRLQRPFIILLVLMLSGGLLYFLGEHAGLIYATQTRQVIVAPQHPVGYPPFYPFQYALQLLIPVLDLREAAYWFPNADIMPWGFLLTIYTWIMIMTGWMVVLALIPGINRYIRNR